MNNASVPFELREQWLREEVEALVLEPFLVKVSIPGLPPIALKWYASDRSLGQFYFPVFPPKIPEWDMIGLSEWCVIGVGIWSNLGDKFRTSAQLSYEPSDWVVVLGVNHSLTDFQNREMFGRPYFARLATRVVGSGSNVQNITPEEFTGDLKFKPIEERR